MGKTVCSAVINHGSCQTLVTALEFYSGIGGMHFACERAANLGHIPAVEVLAAFDINPVANAVYEHNFGSLVRRVSDRPSLHAQCAEAQQS
jgi:site-specific DNA-cytosine methylase